MIVYRLICVVQTALPASKEIQAAEPPPHLGTVSFHHEEPACAGTVHEPPPHLGTNRPTERQTDRPGHGKATIILMTYDKTF